MGADPTMYAPLVSRAIDGELKRMEGMLRETADDRIRYFLEDWRHKLQRVYAEGLRDGFVQGVEANSRPTDQQPS